MAGVGVFYQDILTKIVLPRISQVCQEYEGIESLTDLHWAFQEETGSAVEAEVFLAWCQALGISLTTHSTLNIPAALQPEVRSYEDTIEEQAGLGGSPAASAAAGSRPSQVHTPLVGNSFLNAPAALGPSQRLDVLKGKNPPPSPWDAGPSLAPDADVRSIMADLH